MNARPAPGLPCGLVADSIPAEAGTHDCRCGCGSLLARLRPDGLELKCRRCKRVVMLTFTALSAGEVGAPHSVC